MLAITSLADLFCLVLMSTLANGITVMNANADQFISDFLNLGDFGLCDLGYVFDGDTPKISIPIHNNQRYVNLLI